MTAERRAAIAREYLETMVRESPLAPEQRAKAAEAFQQFEVARMASMMFLDPLPGGVGSSIAWVDPEYRERLLCKLREEKE